MKPIFLLVLAFVASIGSASAGQPIKDSLDGYWLVIAAKFPDGEVKGKKLVKGKCEATYCVAGAAEDSKISLKYEPALWGRIDLNPDADGRQPTAQFKGVAWGELVMGRKFSKNKPLNAFGAYSHRLSLMNKFQSSNNGPNNYFGGATWVLVKDPNDPRIKTSLWDYVERTVRRQ